MGQQHHARQRKDGQCQRQVGEGVKASLHARPQENRIAESLRLASSVFGSVGPMASNSVTTFFLAASSFHLRSRRTISSSSFKAPSRSPLASSPSARS